MIKYMQHACNDLKGGRRARIVLGAHRSRKFRTTSADARQCPFFSRFGTDGACDKCVD